ncbi:MAG: HlyD family efflux transporter periplasmic adaptor subunit [Anaerolineales bacterium]|nr:HlyD family efflux transporter periplasmic adaptor subunit [Anaerolineales bacterium]
MNTQKISFLIIIMFTFVIIVGCSSESTEKVDLIRASGFLEGQTYSLSSLLGGRVESVSVTTGDAVESDAVILQLDAEALEQARNQARAGVDAAYAGLRAIQERPSAQELTEARTAVLVAEARLRAAEATLDFVGISFVPFEPPESEIVKAELNIEVAQAGLDLAEAQLAQVNAGAYEGELKVAESQIAEAEANLRLIERQLEELKIVAPIDGVIHQVLVKLGEVAPPGSSLIQLMDPEVLTLTVYIPVEQVTLIEPGVPVQISADAYPGETFQGSVLRIADEAQFTPSKVLTEEERVKLVFAVEIEILDPSGQLKPGMPVDVEITP